MVNNGATDNNLTSRSFVVTVGTVTEQLRQAPGGQIVLTVTGPAGSNYVIQTSTDLINWIPFSTNTVPPGGSLEVVDMNPMVSQKFYRTAPYVARVPSPPQISGFSMNNSVYNFNLSGPAGSSFVIQSSTDLVNWTPFATNTIPGSGSVQIIDTNPGPNFKFYRALPYTTPANNAATVARLPQLTSLKMTNGVFSFTLNGAAGSNYVIQASTDLAHWTAFTTNTISPNGSVDIVDLQATAPQKFYRAVPYHSAIVSPSLQLSGLSMSNGVFSFVLTGTGGSNYIIQQSPNLVNWTPITTNTIPASGSVTILDSNPNSPQKFYRAEGF